METPEITTRVRELITRSGLSDADFARRSDLKPNKLSKSLASVGGRRFTSLELARIADANAVTVDWILNGRSRAQPALAARKIDSSVSDGADAAVHIAQRYANADEVLRLIGVERPGYSQPPVELSGRYVTQGAELADWAWKAIRAAGISNLDDLPSIMETVFGVDTAITDMPPGYAGLSWQTDGFRLAITSPEATPGRQRFTLAHELGHLLAHDSNDLHVEYTPNGVPFDSHPSEVRANVFAASLLAPEEILRSKLEGKPQIDGVEFCRLTVELGISPAPLLIRIKACGLAPSGGEADNWRWTSRVCAEKAGMHDLYLQQTKSSLASRWPTRLINQLYDAYMVGNVGIRPLADLLDIDVDAALDIFAAQDVELDDDSVRVA